MSLKIVTCQCPKTKLVQTWTGDYEADMNLHECNCDFCEIYVKPSKIYVSGMETNECGKQTLVDENLLGPFICGECSNIH